MKHKHADLMLQYAKDAQTTDKPWELWEICGDLAEGDMWLPLYSQPAWETHRRYRRKAHTTPLQFTVNCTMPMRAISPEEAARKFRELVADGTLLVTVTDLDGLVHCSTQWEGRS